MIEFETARAKVLESAKIRGVESVPLRAALHRVLAEDVHAPRAIPDADTSAMDGYALRAADLVGDGPWSLPVSGVSRAGEPLRRLDAGAACRIFTGALLPEDADAVLLQENARIDGATLHLGERTAAFDNVRRRGSEVEAGTRVLAKGERLSPYGLGLLASVDCAAPRVFLRPRVNILCTGDELRDVGAPHRPGSVAESNSVALSAMALQAGALVQVLPRVGDDAAAAARAIDAALDDADLVLTVGGASVGDHDVVQRALERAGVRVEFWKVRIKPGKPLMFATHGDCLVLGLPGNPVSAQVTFGLFGLPLLRAMQGMVQPLPTVYRGELAAPLKQKPGRMNFHRAALKDGLLIPHGNQSSGSTASLAHSDALVVVEPHSDGHPAGARVPYLRLDAL